MGQYQPKNSNSKLWEKYQVFDGGLNLVDEDANVLDSQSRILQNINLIADSSIKKRTGFESKFNFLNARFFDYIFHPEIEKETHTPIDFPTEINQTIDISIQFLNIVHYIQEFAMVSKLDSSAITMEIQYDYKEDIYINKIDLDQTNKGFDINSSVGEQILNKDWEPYYDIGNLDPNARTLTTDLDLDWFTIQPPVIKIPITNLPSFLQNDEYYRTLLISTENHLELTINGESIFKIEFPDNEYSKLTNPNIYLKITIQEEPKPETLIVKKYINVYDPDNIEQIAGYLVAFTYNLKLWFLYYDINLDKYSLLEWYLLDFNKVKKFKFVEQTDKSLRTVTITKSLEYYYAPNQLVWTDTVKFPFIGIDLITYRNNIYVFTGYGFLEINYSDILSRKLYELIPFKPTSNDYRNNYANLLALDTINKTNFQFDELWNWDWVNYPTASYLAGLIQQYPANSYYPTVLRAIINFSDTQMVNIWQYSWRWLAPQINYVPDSKQTIDNTMPVIADFTTGGYELHWKPISREETVNNYVITNPGDKQTLNVPFTTTTDFKHTGDGIYHNDTFYIGADGSQGAGIKFDISTLITELTQEAKFTSLDLLGSLTVSLKSSSNIADDIKPKQFRLSNFRIETFVKGNHIKSDTSQGYDESKGWFKLRGNDIYFTLDREWAISYDFGAKVSGYRIVNNEVYLKNVIAALKNTGTESYVKIICDILIEQYDIGLGHITATASFNPGINENNSTGMELSLGYIDITPADSNSIGLIPIDNIEQLIDISSINFIRQCTKAVVIQNQIFCWGSKDAPHMLWYSQPFSPGYFPVLNSESLNRFGKEIIKNIIPFGQRFLIFTESTIYIMTINDEGISIETGTTNYGVMFENTIASISNSIIFLSYDGLYQIVSTGQDIGNTIKINPVDLKIKGLVDYYNVKEASAVTIGSNYMINFIFNNNSNFMLNYFILKKAWVQNISNNNLNISQMKNIYGTLYTLHTNGVLNRWYNYQDEVNLLSNIPYSGTSDKYDIDVAKLFSDSYIYTQTKWVKSTKFDPIPSTITIYSYINAPINSTIALQRTDFNLNAVKIAINIWKVTTNEVIVNESDNDLYNIILFALTKDSIFSFLYADTYKPDYKFNPIVFHYKNAARYGIGIYLMNQKKYKEVQLKQISNYFATQSEFTWYVDDSKNINPIYYEYAVQNEQYVTIEKTRKNLQINPGAFIDTSLYWTEEYKEPVVSAFTTIIGAYQEQNIHFKKGAKGYGTAVEIKNSEALPFGLRAFLIQYKLTKPK